MQACLNAQSDRMYYTNFDKSKQNTIRIKTYISAKNQIVEVQIPAQFAKDFISKIKPTSSKFHRSWIKYCLNRSIFLLDSKESFKVNTYVSKITKLSSFDMVKELLLILGTFNTSLNTKLIENNFGSFYSSHSLSRNTTGQFEMSFNVYQAKV